MDEEDFELKYLPYIIALTDRARELRKKMTHAERIFWGAVRNKRFLGLKFVRQKPLLGFIADFYCAQLKLVIEVDGDSHNGNEVRDDLRSEKLEKHEITIIRYKNEEIVRHLHGVLSHLSKIVSSLQPVDSTEESPPVS